jgi:hypothetical protein
MSLFDTQYQRQGGRCHWCQHLIPVALITRDHIHPKRNGQRQRGGHAYVLACANCNTARDCLTIGSIRFAKWLRRVMRGDVRRFYRKRTKSVDADQVMH